MKRTITILALALLPVLQLKAQVKIGDNPTTINAGSVLEMESTDKGVLFPRVNLTDLTKWQPLAGTAIAGMTVYNTNTTTGVGLYYWDGAKWVKQLTSNNDAWLTTGNAGTTPAANFLGTTDNNALNFRTNDTTKMTILPNGNVGIGTMAPEAKLSLYNNNNSIYAFDYSIENSVGGIIDDFRFLSYGTLPQITTYYAAACGSKDAPTQLTPGNLITNTYYGAHSGGMWKFPARFEVYFKGDAEGGNAFSQVGLVNSGYYAVYIDSINRVGIGTTTPTSLLELYNNTPRKPLFTTVCDNSDGGVMDDFILYSYGSTPQLTFMMNASRGTMAAPLPLVDGDLIYNMQGIALGTALCSNYEVRYKGDGTNNRLSETRIDNSGARAMTINKNNNIGIGTTAPTEKLEVAGKIKATNVIFTGIPTYTNDATAGAGGLVSGEMYKTATGELRIKL